MHDLLRGLFVFSDGCCLVSYSNSRDFIGWMTKRESTWAELLRKTHSIVCASKGLTLRLPHPNTEQGSPQHHSGLCGGVFLCLICLLNGFCPHLMFINLSSFLVSSSNVSHTTHPFIYFSICVLQPKDFKASRNLAWKSENAHKISKLSVSLSIPKNLSENKRSKLLEIDSKTAHFVV